VGALFLVTAAAVEKKSPKVGVWNREEKNGKNREMLGSEKEGEETLLEIGRRSWLLQGGGRKSKNDTIIFHFVRHLIPAD